MSLLVQLLLGSFLLGGALFLLLMLIFMSVTHNTPIVYRFWGVPNYRGYSTRARKTPRPSIPNPIYTAPYVTLAVAGAQRMIMLTRQGRQL